MHTGAQISTHGPTPLLVSFVEHQSVVQITSTYPKLYYVSVDAYTVIPY